MFELFECDSLYISRKTHRLAIMNNSFLPHHASHILPYLLKQRNKHMLNVDKRLTYFCIFCAIYTFSVNNFSLQSLLIKSHLDHSKIRETEYNLRVVSQQCATFFHSSIKPTNCFILLIPPLQTSRILFLEVCKIIRCLEICYFSSICTIPLKETPKRIL